MNPHHDRLARGLFPDGSEHKSFAPMIYGSAAIDRRFEHVDIKQFDQDKLFRPPWPSAAYTRCWRLQVNDGDG